MSSMKVNHHNLEYQQCLFEYFSFCQKFKHVTEMLAYAYPLPMLAVAEAWLRWSVLYVSMGLSTDPLTVHYYTTTIVLWLFWILSGTTRVSQYQKGKTNLDLLEQEIVSGICWAICKSAPHSRQITMPVPHHSVFYRPDALPAAQPTATKHWRQNRLSTL